VKWQFAPQSEPAAAVSWGRLSLQLGCRGTITGLALAWGLVAWFRATGPIELPPGARVTLDWRVLLFAVLCGMISSMAFGLFPAWRGARADVNEALKIADHSRGTSAGFQRATQAHVVVQVALSMVLLAGAGLLSESLWKLASTNLGYRTEHLFTGRIHLPEDRYDGEPARSHVAGALEENSPRCPE